MDNDALCPVCLLSIDRCVVISGLKRDRAGSELIVQRMIAASVAASNETDRVIDVARAITQALEELHLAAAALPR